jgi:hypothetical protein
MGKYFRGCEEGYFDLRKVGNINEWHHVVLVYGEQDVKIYVDGEFRLRNVKTVPERSAHVINIDLFKGMDAVIDDVQIFNQALSPESVKLLFTN